MRFLRQKFDFGIGIGRPDELLLVNRRRFIIHMTNCTSDATSWLFCKENLPSPINRGPQTSATAAPEARIYANRAANGPLPRAGRLRPLDSAYLGSLRRVKVRVAIDSAMKAPTPIAMSFTGALKNTAAE